MPQTRRQIEAILNEVGIRPLKRFGQHFLIDGNLLRKLVAAAEIRREDVVLEVGPGTGTLTEMLLEEAGHVVAAEIDRGLCAVLQGRLGGSSRFTLVQGDVLATKSQLAPAVVDVLIARQRELGGRILLVANLPYNVGTPVIADLVLGNLPVSRLCFTVQAEVADRLLSPPGSKDYGPISIVVQARAIGTRIARVPPQAFWPIPEVDSAMVRLDLQPGPADDPAVRRWLGRVVHDCFQHRRKTLGWSLRRSLPAAAVERIAADGRWNLEARPEKLTVAQWLDLAAILASADASG